MRSVLSRLRGRLKHGLALQEILDQFARRGLVLYPYIVFEEVADARFSRSCELESLRARELTEEDIKHVTGIPARLQSETKVRDRFRRGQIGVGAFDGEALVAYSWCDLKQFGGIGQNQPRRELATDEAYLYDAYTIPEYRGHGIVPFLRSEVYKLLQARGRNRLFSVSLFFNRSARRFKSKLGASAVELRLSINLFEKYKRDLLLKRYAATAPIRQA